jgi:hypothetical protein
MVEREDRGVRFPLQIPLLRLQSRPESLLEHERHHVGIGVPGVVFPADDDLLHAGVEDLRHEGVHLLPIVLDGGLPESLEVLDGVGLGSRPL